MAHRLENKIPSVGQQCDFPVSAMYLLKALAQRSRLNIILILSRGDCTLGDLSEEARITMSNCSQHLTVLKREGIVRARRDGCLSIYSLASKRKALVLEIMRRAIQHV
jgi:DNA-binding transcriptional ArsR family regulator